MQCYTELTPPTAVTHSVSLPLTSAAANNLVVAKTSLLQVFALKQISYDIYAARENGDDAIDNPNATSRAANDDDGLEDSFLGADNVLQRTEDVTVNKLVLVAEFPLSGTVTSLARVKTLSSKSGGESLLVAFKDAKLSLVEWDPALHSLSTVSIHFYEQEDIQGSPWAPHLGNCVNYLTTDPGSRCAALKFGDRNVAIIPFRQADEDIAMDDWDEEIDGPRPQDSTAVTNGDGKDTTPYMSSFVLRLPTLDPALIHPIHISFLHEYREPTFGVLAASMSPSSGLLLQRKDLITYMVFSLDLERKASTTILSVSGLPYDLFKVVPLPSPIGGALLVGGNEFIHIDQAGKANGVAVNIFAKQCTSFGLADQSDLEMRLEDCTVELVSLESKDLLIILSTGELAILTFRMDGRSISGLSIKRVPDFSFASCPSTTSGLGSSSMFIGSEEADAVILGWNRIAPQGSKRKGRDTALAEDDIDNEEMDDIDDDDLYGDAPVTSQTNGLTNGDAAKAKIGEYQFHIHDSMVNIAPLQDVTFGKKTFPTDSEDAANSADVTGDLELVAVSGSGHDSALSIIKREIEPKVVGRFEFPEARGIWTMNVRKPSAPALQGKKAPLDSETELGAEFDRFMIVSKASDDDSEESSVYALTATEFEPLTTTEFDPAAGATIEAGTLGKGMRLIQVLTSEVRSYDGDLGLAQILPLVEEETESEPKVVSASLADPFILLLRDNGSLFLARCDDNNELDEVELQDALASTKWIAGCLYTDLNGYFAPQTDKGLGFGENIVMFLLSDGGALHIYTLPDLTESSYVADGLCFMPPKLSSDYVVRRTTARVAIKEILVADLGDNISKSPHLIVRPENDELAIYQPYRTTESGAETLTASLHFSKVSVRQIQPEAVSGEATGERFPLRVLSNVGGYSAVFMPGECASFVIKSSQTLPRIVRLRGSGIRGISGFHTTGCERGFIYADFNGVARVSQLPRCNMTQIGMPLQKLKLGEVIHGVTYHPDRGLYVIATSTWEAFELPKDDDSNNHHREWQKEDTPFKPRAERGFIKLVDPITCTIINTIELEPCEIALCIETLNLEISETSHEKKLLITVGTAITKGEDLPIKGSVRVYDIVTVVPEPDRPETDKKLKLLAREDIPRGAVTAISEIGSQGFMLVAQGQKCMVRGLKEDGTLLPVAFMDVNCFVTSIKELPGTGLCLIADAVKGLWLVGYTEEPYKMSLFGKSTTSMEVMAAELLPDGNELYIVVADASCNLHVLQFDPEHPKSLQGHLLLHRTAFSLGGHLPTTMTLLPRSKATPLAPDAMADDSSTPEHEILLTMNTGSIGLVSALTESQYRRLSTLASHLGNTLPHACGLNPKAHRISKQVPEGILGGGRTIVDGTLLSRWTELGSQRRVEVAGRVGMDVDEVMDDLAALRGGLGYL